MALSTSIFIISSSMMRTGGFLSTITKLLLLIELLFLGPDERLFWGLAAADLLLFFELYEMVSEPYAKALTSTVLDSFSERLIDSRAIILI